MADNETTLANELGDFEDWIELHNPTAVPIDVSGLYLTDTENNLIKSQIPQGTSPIAAGGYLLIWADNPLPGTPGLTELHAAFRLGNGARSRQRLSPAATRPGWGPCGSGLRRAARSVVRWSATGPNGGCARWWPRSCRHTALRGMTMS